MKSIAFLVPSTSKNRDWKNLNDTYLYQHLLPSINSLSKNFSIKVFIGIDDDDELYTNLNYLPTFYPPLLSASHNITHNKIHYALEWIKMKDMKGKPTSIWNSLATEAIKQDYDYLMILGDDIVCDKRNEWLGIFLKNLKKNNNIGFSAGWSNNDDIPTQFLIHKTHIDIFGFVYPPTIKNWGCDDWMAQLYGQKYGYWNKEYKLLNVGGEPRYDVEFPKQYILKLVKRHKNILHKYIDNANLQRKV